MRVGVFVKQIPQFEAMTLGADGRLQRDGLPLEMNAYCRRAVAQAVALAGSDDEIVVFTLGPAAADDVVREAIAWGDLHGKAATRGVHVCDPAFAGSDTLATARALAAALRQFGPFDLVLCGRNSIDADTGQVGPQVAELLDLPFVHAARNLTQQGSRLDVRTELDDGTQSVTVELPAVVACAERLIDPSKVDPAGRAAVATDRIERVDAAMLGPGPWGAAASPTRVGETRAIRVERTLSWWPDASVGDQVERAVTALQERARSSATPRSVPAPLRSATPTNSAMVVVLAEPGGRTQTLELLTVADRLAGGVAGRVCVIGPKLAVDDHLGDHGADIVVAIDDATTELDLAPTIESFVLGHDVRAILAPGTAFGRELAARLAVRLGSGLTGDAVDVEWHSDRLIAWKPAFGGSVHVAIHCDAPIHLVTIRPGVVEVALARAHQADSERLVGTASGRIHHGVRVRDDDLDRLSAAEIVLGVGRGVPPDRYGELELFRRALGAELAATRKVTDAGWLPRSRQLGITGRSIRPALYFAIGAHGKYNHAVGYRNAGTIVAIDRDREAPVFSTADVGIVGDWAEVVLALVRYASALSESFAGR